MYWPSFVMSVMSGVITLVILIFIFSLIAMNKTNSWFNLLKLYFSIIAIVGVLWVSISVGIAGYSRLRSVFITDEEYVTGRNAWEIQQCDEPMYFPAPKMIQEVDTWPNPKVKKKTPEEIQKCKNKATQRLVLQRHLDAKESILWGLVWGVIFLFLFLSHYPRMVKQHQLLEADEPKRPRKKTPTKVGKKRIAKK